MTELGRRIDARIRNIPDFPKPGILFKDITPILQDGTLFHDVIAALYEPLKNEALNYVAGIESRGFIFASALASKLGAGIILLRKPGKLPWRTVRATYQLEYGIDAIEMHEDAVKPGDRVAVVDDLLATGGTATAACCLLRDCGAEVRHVLFMIELGFLSGREKLRSAGFSQIHSLLCY